MGKRTRSFMLSCTFDGCKERGWGEYDNQKELSEWAQRNKTWRCVRHHNDANDVLSPEQTILSTVLVNSDNNIWRREGKESGGSGFVYGEGYKAFSEDWPAGTKLRITAEIISYNDREPQPTDGPDYHADHQAWIERQKRLDNPRNPR